MKKKLLSALLILCMLIAAVPLSVLAASGDHPIRMTAEPDPESSLSGPGTLSFVRFVIRNTGDEDYTLYDPVLSSDVLDEDHTLYFERSGETGAATGKVTLEPGVPREFRIYDVYIPADALNTDVRFTLSWEEAVSDEAAEPWEEEEPWDAEEPDDDPYPGGEDPYPEEGDREQPRRKSTGSRRTDVTYVKRKISTAICVETADEPVMDLNVKADSSLTRTDGTVTVKYVLTNRSKFDFEEITLSDAAAGGEIGLEEDTLRAGETITVMHRFSMGRENAVLCPEATYTVRGKTCRVKCTKPVTVEYMYDSLTLDVEQYAAAEEGTMFSLTVTNAGTHRMTEIRLEDETGTELCQPFSLNPGKSRAVTYTYGSYSGLTENRHVSFLIYATDSEGDPYFYQKPGSYEIRPYVGSGQVSLQMNVTLSDYFEEKNTVQLLFEIRNYSDVAIHNAVITENEVLGTSVRNYPTLTKGVTTFTMEFELGAGVSVLTFRLDADDAGGTHYATEPVSLHVDQLALTIKNGTFGAAQNTVIDTSGTVFDTDKYRSYINTGLLAILLAAFILILISCMFRGAEKYVLRVMPEAETAARITGASSAVQDTARLRFGYVKPAKLRYAETEETAAGKAETDRTFSDGERSKTAPHTTAGRYAERDNGKKEAPFLRAGSFKTKDTGTYEKQKKQVRMLTTDDTRVFEAPVAPRGKTAFITREEMKKETPPGSGVKKPVRKAAAAVTAVPEKKPAVRTEQVKKPAGKDECLKAGRPYTFELGPVPAVVPKEREPEIVFIG